MFAVKSIGRNSFVISLRCGVLINDTTSVLFQMVRMNPSLMELLKIAHIGADFIPKRSCKTQLGNVSGPTNLLVFIFMSFFSTVFTEMMYSLGTWFEHGDNFDISKGGRSLVTDW